MTIKKGQQILYSDIRDIITKLRGTHSHPYQNVWKGEGNNGYNSDPVYESWNTETSTNVLNMDDPYYLQISDNEALASSLDYLQNHTHVFYDKRGTACNCNCACVSKDTLIQMADGSFKLITEIKNGDYVLSHNFATGLNEPQLVSNWFMLKANRTALAYTDKGIYITTPDHRYWNEEAKTYTSIQDGMEYFTTQSGKLAIKKVEILEEELVSYDFEVANNHNFWMKASEDAELVLSSNCDCTRGSW